MPPTMHEDTQLVRQVLLLHLLALGVEASGRSTPSTASMTGCSGPETHDNPCAKSTPETYYISCLRCAGARARCASGRAVCAVLEAGACCVFSRRVQRVGGDLGIAGHGLAPPWARCIPFHVNVRTLPWSSDMLVNRRLAVLRAARCWPRS